VLPELVVTAFLAPPTTSFVPTFVVHRHECKSTADYALFRAFYCEVHWKRGARGFLATIVIAFLLEAIVGRQRQETDNGEEWTTTRG